MYIEYLNINSRDVRPVFRQKTVEQSYYLYLGILLKEYYFKLNILAILQNYKFLLFKFRNPI